MSTVRFFGGGREPGKRSAASELMRFEIEKKGKLPPGERYKMLLKKKLAESRQKAMFNKPGGRTMSKRAEQALKEIAAKKAAKEAKALRRMVIVQPKIYHNGKLNAKGNILDIEGNIVGKIDTKNGKMTASGSNLGKYKPGSSRTHQAIMGAIDKYSPYYIKQRKLQEAQSSVYGQMETVNLFGVIEGKHDDYAKPEKMNLFGDSGGKDRTNVGITAFGAMADNPWGVFADNAWGTMSDNVWGTASSNIWGGIGGSPFGKGVQFFGTGNGKNYLQSLTNIIKAYFGIRSKSGKEAFKAVVKARSAAGSNTSVRTAPVRTR
jgi:hypothetical protein